jgi:hypothetical protein
VGKVLELISGVSDFVAPYPSWVKVLLALWGVLSLSIVFALVFTRPSAIGIGEQRIEPPKPAKPERVPPPKPEPPMIFVTTIIKESTVPVRWQLVDIPDAEDKFGKKLAVSIGVLWDPYRWVFGSGEFVGIGEHDHLPIDKVIEGLPGGETRPIIAVGTASHENSKDRPEVEAARALIRADKLVALCQKKYPAAPIWSLSLGYFRGKGSASSSATERRVILLVVTDHEPGADFPSGIRDALLKAAVEKNFSFDARDYSNFSEKQFQVARRSPGAGVKEQTKGKAG